jgi:hypothetical protein
VSEPKTLVIDEQSIRRGWGRLWRFLLYWGVLLTAAGTAYGLAVAASDPHVGHHFLLIALGVVAGSIVLILPAARQYLSNKDAAARIAAAEADREAAETRATDAENSAAEARELAVDLQARFNSSIGDVISPIASELAGLAACEDDMIAETRGAVLQQIVDAAVTLCGGEGVRAAIYMLGVTAEGKPGDLFRKTWGGRKDPPRRFFARRRGDARERAVHELVRTGSYDLQENVDEMPDRSLYRGKRYKSFVAVAVMAGQEPRGMLAVDAPEAARFDHTHLGILLALAGLTAIALGAKAQRVDVDFADAVPVEG